MNTPLIAMLWELWRTSRAELFGRMAFHSLMVLLCAGIGQEHFPGERDVLRGVVIMMVSVGCVFSVTWMSALDDGGSGFRFSLAFSRPVSSTQLVLVPMLYTMAYAVVSFWVVAGLFCLASGSTLPIVGLSAGIACAVACFVATAWSPSTKVGRWISVVAVLIGFVALITVFHLRREESEPWLLVMGRSDYFQFAWYYYAMCVVVSAMAAVVAIVGVDRKRHGDKWRVFKSNAKVFHWPDRVQRRSRQPFRNEFAAQYWCETQRIGHAVFPFAICAPLIPIAWVVSAPLFAEKTAIWRGTPIIWISALILSPFAFHAFGADRAVALQRRQGASWLSSFDATAPMASDRLAAIKLIALSVCTFTGWLLMFLAAVCHSAIIGNWEVWAQIGNRLTATVEDVSGVYWCVGLAACVLLCISSSSMILTFVLWVAKNERYFAAIVAVGMAHGALLLASDIFKWNVTAYWIAVGYALAIGILVVCGRVLLRAYTAGYFGKPLLQLTFVLWSIYVVSSIVFYVKAAPGITSRFDIPIPVYAIAAASLLVPLAATAAAPVALDSHRHS